MNLKYGLIVIISIIIFLAAYNTITTENKYQRIDIAGSTSVQPVAEALAEKYMEKNPNVKINVQGGGSGLGIRSVSQNIIDIGTSSKALKQEEKSGLKEYIIGKEGIDVVVNLKNPVNSLTSSQLKDIFSGKIKNWKDVGGPDAAINVVQREDGSGTRGAFEKLVMGKIKVRSDAIVQTSTESVKLTVKQDPNAIGYVSLAHMSDDVKALNVDGIIPSEATIMDGSYKLQTPFIFLTNGEPEGVVKDFLNWISSPEGQKIISDQKIVPTNST
jgi:phosphate transport system substrate-binding protein